MSGVSVLSDGRVDKKCISSRHAVPKIVGSMTGNLTEGSLSDTTASSPRDDSPAEGEDSFGGGSFKSSNSCTDNTPRDDDYKEDFQGLFDELLHSISEGDIEGLDGYLSEGEFAHMSSELKNERAWECEPEKKRKKQGRQEDAEREEATIKDGKLPRPCIGKPKPHTPSQGSLSPQEWMILSPLAPLASVTLAPLACRSVPLQEGAVQPRVPLPAVQAARHPLPNPTVGQKGPPDAHRAARARRAGGPGGSRGGCVAGGARSASRARDATDDECDGTHVNGGCRRNQPMGCHESSACRPSCCIQRVEHSERRAAAFAAHVTA